jgi:hypothetical protein
VILPDLAKRIAWFQEHLRPKDEAFGHGASDWTITAEYRDGLEVDGQPIWGCMCSPSMLPEMAKLTPEDIAAKRAHIIVRTPTNAAELAELDPTLLHEMGHVLVAPLDLPRDSEEEIMHSLDHLFSKLAPEHRAILARARRNPMARAYRAGEGSMPEQTEEKKDPDKSAEDKKPPMQEGGDMSVEEIKAKMIEAVLAGQPTDELAKALVAAMAKQGANGQRDSTIPPPPPPPTMGMAQEDAYARAKREAKAEAEKKAVASLVDNLPGLDDKTKAYLRKRATIDDVNEALAVMPRASVTEAPKMGMQGNPKLDPKGAASNPMARARAEAEDDPVFREALGIGSAKHDGIHYDVPGHIIYIDGSERLRYQREQFMNRRAAR